MITPGTIEVDWTYDNLVRLVDELFNQYDAYGRQNVHVDFAGRVVENVFDDSSAGLGRLAETRFFDNLTSYNGGLGTPAETVAYTYDDLGRILTIVDDRGTTSYTYNNDGLTTKIASPEGIIRYEYEPLTNRLTRTFTTDAPGEVLNDINYTYDGFGRLKTVTVVERNDVPLVTPETTSYSYDPLGNLDRVDLPNGVVTDYAYDTLNRLDKLTHYEPDATPQDLTDNARIAEFDYDVRADGKRTGVTETYYQSGSPQTIRTDWTYDNLGRLVDEVFNHYDDLLDQTLHFTHDLVGNRLEQSLDKGNDASVDEKITYTYDDNDRLLSKSKDADNNGTVDQTTTYSYSATEQTGKTVVDESTSQTVSQTSFTYNLQGRLESVIIETYDGTGILTRKEVTTYDYDGNDIRVSALHEVDSDGDGTFDTRTLTEYLADPNNHTGYSQTIEEIVIDADTGTEIKKIVYTIGHDVIAQTTFTPSGPTEGETIVLLYDGHGSTRLVADLAAQVLEAYDAYGNAIGFNPATALTALLYSGESFDPRINQQYLRARWYDASTGRFNRLDPFSGNLRDPQSLHKYLYTHGDPVNAVDPTGEYARAIMRMISGMGFWAVARILLGLAAEYTIRLAYLREVNNSPNVQWKNEQIGRVGDRDLPQGRFRDEFKLKPDILDKDLKTFYEIKSTFPLSVVRGQRQLARYQDAIDLRFPADFYRKGLWNPRQISYRLRIPGWIDGFPLPLYVHVHRSAPGLVLYSEWDVQKPALIAGLVGVIAPDIIRHIWQVWRGPGAAPGPNILPFPGQRPPFPMPVRPVAAGIGAVAIGRGFAGLGGFAAF